LARIVLATIGSLGDLHPCLAIGRELLRRGHTVTVATTDIYRDRVERLGLRFAPIRPDWSPQTEETIRRCADLRRGPEILFRELVVPHVEASYHDLLAVCRESDLLVAGEIVFAAPLVAQKLGLPWASLILAPSSLLSACDPSVLPGLEPPRWAGVAFQRMLLRMVRLAMRNWWEPIHRLRRQQGLPASRHPFFEDKFSPHLVLAMFSPAFAHRQPDWPANTAQPGFAFFDNAAATSDQQLNRLYQRLAEFLDEGEPPVVLTLGSTAVINPGNFFSEGLQAVRSLGLRAVLLGAPEPESDAPQPDAAESGATRETSASRDVFRAAYAPYSQVFPRAAAVVHQGGAGTTAQALLAGCPMLAVPYGWDQPDNGARVARLGAGLTLARHRFNTKRVAASLARLTGEPGFRRRAQEISREMAAETGASTAVAQLETLLTASPQTPRA
jgi:rhamnosyltransferase subunit B